MEQYLSVYELLGLSARMLRKEDLAYDFLEGSLPPPTDSGMSGQVTLDTNSYEYKLFMTAVNNVCEDLATQYSLLCYEETFSGNKIKYSDLEYNIAKVIEVKDPKGNKTKFYRSSDGLLFSKTDTYTILYTYKPNKITGNTQIILYPIVPKAILACGVCAQYCIMDGLFDEAEMWESRYKEALLGQFRQTKNIKMRAKIWQ